MYVELKESAKDTAKQGKESMQETGSKIAEKGQGNNDSSDIFLASANQMV